MIRFAKRVDQRFLCRYEDFHNNLVMGIAVREGDESPGDRSGYHPMRLATELFPALVAVIGPGEFSPFWAVLFYFSLVAFGIAQQVRFQSKSLIVYLDVLCFIFTYL